MLLSIPIKSQGLGQILSGYQYRISRSFFEQSAPEIGKCIERLAFILEMRLEAGEKLLVGNSRQGCGAFQCVRQSLRLKQLFPFQRLLRGETKRENVERDLPPLSFGKSGKVRHRCAFDAERCGVESLERRQTVHSSRIGEVCRLWLFGLHCFDSGSVTLSRLPVTSGAILCVNSSAVRESGKALRRSGDLVSRYEPIFDALGEMCDHARIAFTLYLLGQLAQVMLDPRPVSLGACFDFVEKLETSGREFAHLLILIVVDDFSRLDGVPVIASNVVDQSQKLPGLIAVRYRTTKEDEKSND